jgi:hypothetical protein
MTRHKTPTWLLSAEWGMDTDTFNWILFRKRGERWSAKGYYPSVESLLQSLFRRLTRTESADPDLVRHVEAVSKRVEACAAALFDHLDEEVRLREKRLSTREGT